MLSIFTTISQGRKVTSGVAMQKVGQRVVSDYLTPFIEVFKKAQEAGTGPWRGLLFFYGSRILGGFCIKQNACLRPTSERSWEFLFFCRERYLSPPRPPSAPRRNTGHRRQKLPHERPGRQIDHCHQHCSPVTKNRRRVVRIAFLNDPVFTFSRDR